MEKVKIINKLFSTADAEDVSIQFDGYDLLLCFTDWRDVRHVVKFSGAEFLRWDDDIDFDMFSYDCPHEILDSELIRTKGLDQSRFHHYMLCFNAASNLEVISEELKLLEPNTGAQQETDPASPDT